MLGIHTSMGEEPEAGPPFDEGAVVPVDDAAIGRRTERVQLAGRLADCLELIDLNPGLPELLLLLHRCNEGARTVGDKCLADTFQMLA